ncbi:pyridoxal phosphate synthase yaaE subunit [Salsuginibacillus halophilus]|uniref:Pyridoxal 5'-phosphate synthase subunit PdxT n=1 Tax=Salsuginibacillus halophilus TaxID=517424 RepID=A0A2P8HIA9_9BACI|nr:pyridoxal 5'-phosphate synthase glutaminase subunit PdxT [Salsuginibacillus halophilus]PSL45953.1 pyridoxal phosphate synthase yaaE subunit [Salsuginibacillus halophilus]
MIHIGVLALQGAVREHVKALQAEDTNVIVVKRPEQLDEIDGLVLPGGESTTMRRLIDKYNFLEPLRQFAEAGKPVFGTCAGLILMARDIDGADSGHLGLIDMTVERNAFGRQRESFETKLAVEDVAEDVEAVFIRAPLIIDVGEDVRVLATYGNDIVAARQGLFLTCSFHPELTADNRLHQYFAGMVREVSKTALQA